MPSGLRTPRSSSTCAPEMARVRSPIQGKWVPKLYQPVPRTLIRGATVVTMDSAGVLPVADILVTEDRLTEIAPRRVQDALLQAVADRRTDPP